MNERPDLVVYMRSVLHNMAQSMSVIVGSCELLKTCDQCVYIEKIEHIIKYVDILSNQMNEMRHHISEETKKTEPKKIKCKEVFDFIEGNIKPIAESMGIEYILNRGESEGVFVKSSPKVAFEVTLNLLTNAHEAQATRFEHSYEIVDKEIHVSFVDNGVGMDKKILSQCVSPGFSTKSVNDVSKGVGLDYVHALVLRFGGNMTVNSIKSLGTEVKLVFNLV